MQITRVQIELLRVPMARPRASPTEEAVGRHNHVVALLVRVDTDTGLQGLGFAYTLQGSGRALHAVAVDDIAPLVQGEDPLDHERLEAKVYWRLQTIGRRGLVAQAYSAFDLAFWDLKARAADLPLYKLLGGARPSAPAYGADSAWLYMEPKAIIEASRTYLDRGLMGVKVKIGLTPEADADRLTQIREALGEDAWLGVDANQRYDYGTALALGRFLEDEIGADWFEEPISCEDVAGHARLAARLEVPIAAGEMLFGRDEFRTYLERDALGVVQPDVTRLGGLTATLRVIALADLHGRPVSPHVLPEVAVHLACGLPRVTAVEYMPWLFPLWQAPPKVEQGQLVPPPRPGLGLEVDPDAVGRCRVST
jgi:L-alanine-DL-glutamate epimerase-like enolase superfamily enzyme